MTDIVDVPELVVVPTYPKIGQEGFGRMAYDVGTEMPNVVANVNATAQSARTNALAAKEAGQDAIQNAAAAAAESDAAMGFRNQAGAHASSATAAALSATQAEQGAVQAASDAGASANTAMQAESHVAQHASDAQNAKVLAEQYRDQAQVFATQQLVGSSGTSLTPGAGAKAFTIEAGRAFVPGMYVVATSAGAQDHRMSGVITAYDSVTGLLAIAVDEYGGATARADWRVGVAAKGASGLAQQVLTSSASALPGVMYVIAGSNLTLTLPTSGLANGDRIGIRLAVEPTGLQIIDFGSKHFRGKAAGQRHIDRSAFALDITYNENLGEWV